MKLKVKIPRFRRKKEKEEPPPVEKPKPITKAEEPLVPPEQLEKLVGKHIAIVGRKIVATSKTAKRTWKMARKKYRASTIALRYVGNKNVLLKCRCSRK